MQHRNTHRSAPDAPSHLLPLLSTQGASMSQELVHKLLSRLTDIMSLLLLCMLTGQHLCNVYGNEPIAMHRQHDNQVDDVAICLR